MKTLLLLVLAFVPFRAPWKGAQIQRDLIVCAARMEYGQEAATRFLDVRVGTVAGLPHPEVTDTRIVVDSSKARREFDLMHGAVHWFEHNRTGKWTIHPECNADADFLKWSSTLAYAIRVCRKEGER